jgi:hypothetical protein
VNCTNMYEFVKRYAQFRIVKHVEQCLEQLKAGLNDVLPANALLGVFESSCVLSNAIVIR